MTREEALRFVFEQLGYNEGLMEALEQEPLNLNCKSVQKRLAMQWEYIEQPAQVTRLEVIDNNGRAYVNWGVDKLEFSYQDDGRTLKIFTNGTGAKPSWQGLSDDEIEKIYADTEPDSKLDTYYIVLSRAIEQALRNKNEHLD